MPVKPTNAIDLSSYQPVADGRVEIYADEPGSIGRLLGSTECVDRFRLCAERENADFSEERQHTIEDTDSGVKEYLSVKRQTSDTKANPLVFEEMHPSVLVGEPHREDMIVLECRDPKAALMDREERVESGRDVRLRTYEGTGHRGTYFDGDNEQADVVASISESSDGTTYALNCGSSLHNKARIKGRNKKDHLNDILETTGVPDLETLLEEQTNGHSM